MSTPAEAPQAPQSPTATTPATPVKKLSDPIRFHDGVTSKAKLIGIEYVKQDTGDDVCNLAMVKLKAVVVAMKEHKQQVIIKMSLEGVHIIDLKSNEVIHKHPVNRISYIARDPSDPRAFGYIFKSENNELQYLALKTEKAAADVILTLKDLFEVVYDMRKMAKEQQTKGEAAVDVPVQNGTAATTSPTAAASFQQVPAAQPAINIFDLEEPQSPAAQPVVQAQNLFDQPTPVQQFAAPIVPVNRAPKNDNILDFLDTPAPKPAASSASNELSSLAYSPDMFKSDPYSGIKTASDSNQLASLGTPMNTPMANSLGSLGSSPFVGFNQPQMTNSPSFNMMPQQPSFAPRQPPVVPGMAPPQMQNQPQMPNYMQPQMQPQMQNQQQAFSPSANPFGNNLFAAQNNQQVRLQSPPSMPQMQPAQPQQQANLFNFNPFGSPTNQMQSSLGSNPFPQMTKQPQQQQQPKNLW